MLDFAWHGVQRVALGGGLSGASRLHPGRQWALSAGLFVLFAVLGWTALPHDVTRDLAAFDVRDVAADGSGISAPVFVLRANGTAVRFGNAVLTPRGIIRVGVYDPLDPLLAGATEAVSLPADARLFWFLASPGERQDLRDKTTDLALALTRSVLDILRSPEFVADYRDQFLHLFRGDLENGWRRTRDNGAWQALLRGYEPILRDTASRDLRPIVESHFHGVPMRMLRANALTMIDPFHDAEWNVQPVEEALQAAVQEIRDRAIPEQTAARLLQAPPTLAFTRALLDAVATELANDDALRHLVVRMVFDKRLRPYLDDSIERATDLFRIAPHMLVSLHGSTDLNPLASLVIRTMVSGRPDRVVVFMSPVQRDELVALDPAAVHPLERVGPR